MIFQFVVVLASLCLVSSATTSAVTLGSYNIGDAPTVGGLSAGAFFAVQVHIAFSSIFNGAAIFAGVSIC